jgi:hypothetical protein
MWLAREDEVIEGVTMMVDQVYRNMLLFAMEPLNVVPNNRRVRWKLVPINGKAKLPDTYAHSESLIPFLSKKCIWNRKPGHDGGYAF